MIIIVYPSRPSQVIENSNRIVIEKCMKRVAILTRRRGCHGGGIFFLFIVRGGGEEEHNFRRHQNGGVIFIGRQSKFIPNDRSRMKFKET